MTAPGRDFATGSATVTGILAATELRPGELIGGRYRIDRLLGMGGMGLVYRAHDVELDIDVALKLLRPELATRSDAFERFRQELLLARQVSSPHVVRIHDLVRHGESWLISMDFVDGESLEHRIDREGKLDPEEAVRITRQLAEGLGAAHKRGVVHRDLKPANVLLDSKGEALVTDFGVARSAGSTGITGSGVIIGTPEYLSPEQARADVIDGRSDLYALGLILFEMLTGNLPFRGGTPAEMLAQRIVRSPPDADTLVPGLPTFAVRLCARLLALRPAHRFQRAEDVIRAIDDRRLPRGAPPWRALAGAAAALAIVAGAAWMWTHPLTENRVSPAAVAASLDVASMPFLATEASDQPLASAVSDWASSALAATPVLRAADGQRVARALTVLRYDAASARRYRREVSEALHAPLLLETDLRREQAGLVLSTSAWRADRETAEWTVTTPAITEDQFGSALTNWLRDVTARLGNPAEPMPVPQLNGLRLRLEPAPPAGDSTALEARLTVLRAEGDGDAWWGLLDALDHAARRAEAATAARSARDALQGTDRPAQRARAFAALLLGEPAQAAIEARPLADSAPSDLPLRRLLGRALGESGDIDAARAVLSTVVEADERDGESWFLLGKFAIMEGDARRAADDYLVRAQVLANRLDDRRLLGETTNALGIAYAQLGQPQPAADHYERASMIRESLGDVRGQGIALSNLATVRAIQGDFDAAESALHRARAVLAPLGDATAEANVLNALGGLEEERGRFDAALDAYRQALVLRKAAGDQRLTAQSLLNVSYAFFQSGDFDNSEAYGQQAIAAYESVDDQAGLAQTQQATALTRMAIGRFEEARLALASSIEVAEGGQMAAEHAASQVTLAELDRLEGRFNEALRSADAAARMFASQEDERGKAESTIVVAQSMVDIGAFARASALLEAGSSDPPSGREHQARLRLLLADAAIARSNAETAVREAREALKIAESAGSKGTVILAEVTLADALGAAGEHRAALDTLRSALGRSGQFASIPLRLRIAESALRLRAPDAIGQYRTARATLARLPAWGRAFRLHAAAIGVDPDAPRAAREAWLKVRATTPAEHQPALDELAKSLGIDTEGAT